MKKILLSLAFIGATSIAANAQTTLSQTGGAAPTTNTIFCPLQSGTPPQTVGTQATSYYRSYTMTAATKIVSVKVGNIVNLATGTGAPTSFPITVTLHKSNGAFPASSLTQLATVNKALPKSAVDSQNNLIPATENIALPTPVPVAVGDIIVVEVSHATVNGGLFLMGAVAPTATGTSGFIKATNCGIANPTDISTVNVGTPPAPANGKIVLDLVEDASASSEQFFTENFNLYPNPTSDVLNISSKNGLEMKEIKITDLSGRVVRTLNNVSTINVSDLSAGTYLIDITTMKGKASSKFVKK
ncbi:T9SS type A sorting domain-containing protein [Flavobacterium sp. CBA20B-1]|uniref:T9SS type A sorting domain-containing protein n=1 Tax=unclassified Flavobacterium TaxID=196869 RepID=UPI0022246B6D|nr:MULTISPECIES: T9SS type A sorting domain-containing protein [unclassified Flavobacterium]WCM40905.1 T9SS type A sorting domain-containing protein [Flavobacterium sp. CBA20B-1]